MSQKYLPWLETRVYFLCHAAFVLNAIWRVYSVRKDIQASSSSYDFSRGWFSLSKERSDTEWEYFKGYVVNAIPWITCHVVLSQLLKITGFGRLLPWCHTVIGVAYLTLEIGLFLTTFLLLTVIPYYLLPPRWGGRGVVLLAVISLLVANLAKSDLVYFWIIHQTNLSASQFYLFIVCVGWLTLKCISFALDKQDSETGDLFEFSHFLGYLFYFPTFYLGPPIIYTRFKSCYSSDTDRTINLRVLKTFVRDLLKVFFWALVLELSQHFLYLASLHHAPRIINQFEIFALFGYGYLMGQYFQVKYVVLYGLACAFAKLDGIETPPGPICVGRVHKYSDMWKHFDRGLYEFLVKYIYARFNPRSSGNNRKIFAMLTTFTFIYVWHGYFLVILAWSVLNVFGIFLEGVVKNVQRSAPYHTLIVQRFSPNTVLRIEAAVGTHLLILAVISNFFFLANYNVGVLFLKRTYCSGIITYIGASISLIFMYFTSEHCQRTINRK